ncbi:MAG: flagellar hook-length control protein FliK [Candidatus Wallbacteria bacterium]|nr:flagellar hook-length control protein FliK [Candidatus Wallbacteria bacterium]
MIRLMDWAMTGNEGGKKNLSTTGGKNGLHLFANILEKMLAGNGKGIGVVRNSESETSRLPKGSRGKVSIPENAAEEVTPGTMKAADEETVHLPDSDGMMPDGCDATVSEKFLITESKKTPGKQKTDLTGRIALIEGTAANDESAKASGLNAEKPGMVLVPGIFPAGLTVKENSAKSDASGTLTGGETGDNEQESLLVVPVDKLWKEKTKFDTVSGRTNIRNNKSTYTKEKNGKGVIRPDYDHSKVEGDFTGTGEQHLTVKQEHVAQPSKTEIKLAETAGVPTDHPERGVKIKAGEPVAPAAEATGAMISAAEATHVNDAPDQKSSPVNAGKFRGKEAVPDVERPDSDGITVLQENMAHDDAGDADFNLAVSQDTVVSGYLDSGLKFSRRSDRTAQFRKEPMPALSLGKNHRAGTAGSVDGKAIQPGKSDGHHQMPDARATSSHDFKTSPAESAEIPASAAGNQLKSQSQDPESIMPHQLFEISSRSGGKSDSSPSGDQAAGGRYRQNQAAEIFKAQTFAKIEKPAGGEFQEAAVPGTVQGSSRTATETVTEPAKREMSQLAREVRQQISVHRGTEIRINFDREQFGDLEVRARFSGGKLEIEFFTKDPETRAWLAENSSGFKQDMEKHEINVARYNVHDREEQSGGQKGQSGERRRQSYNKNKQSGKGNEGEQDE